MTKPLFKNPPPGLRADGSLEPRAGVPLTPEELKARTIAYYAKEKELTQKTELPFLYGWKWYGWAREFAESRNPINLLCAANQISKSSTQIRKCINWATDQKLWPELWNLKPVQFWYLYPTQKQVNAEFETKWKLFLPTGSMKDDEYYGYTIEKNKGDIVALHFHSGVHVYFKTYNQNADALQSGTCDAIFCDEELPFEHYEELMMRISASNGYFHMVFTATLGQDEWRRAMEPEEGEVEFLADAYKKVVSLYDAMVYEDGSPSHWTIEKIKMIEARCSTHNEVLKRIYGRFITIGGRKYEAFDIKKHIKPKHPVPRAWLIYEGVDIGSGDVSGHPSAICFIAVRPDFRAGRVFLGWRGDGIPTTAGDVVTKHIELKKENKIQTTGQAYDWGSKDFVVIATRMGETFVKAEKGHDTGENTLNTLFKHSMLYLYDDPEIMKLANELATLKNKTLKKHAKDDFCDALRYAVMQVPWDFSVITGAAIERDEELEEPMNDMQRQIKDRRKAFEDDEKSERERVEDEFNEWNEAYDGY